MLQGWNSEFIPEHGPSQRAPAQHYMSYSDYQAHRTGCQFPDTHCWGAALLHRLRQFSIAISLKDTPRSSCSRIKEAPPENWADLVKKTPICCHRLYQMIYCSVLLSAGVRSISVTMPRWTMQHLCSKADATPYIKCMNTPPVCRDSPHQGLALGVQMSALLASQRELPQGFSWVGK